MPSFSFIKKKASDVASAASSTASTTVSTIKHGAVQAAETTGGVAAATTVGVEIWLDGTRLLEQNLTMPRAGKTEAGDLELSRLTYGLGHLQMGIHNVTVVVGSAERPPRFEPCQNTSLFLSTTVGEPSRAAVPEAVRIRGFKYVLREERHLDFREAGDFVVTE